MRCTRTKEGATASLFRGSRAESECLDGSLSWDLVERVLSRFGLADSPSVDCDGLDRLYAAWCANVPFDNTRKVLALRTSERGPLPGIDPDDFLRAWLKFGTGGTCWPACNALCALLAACGFQGARATASFGVMGQTNHGTIVVRIGRSDYLVDPSLLLNRVLRLRLNELGVDDDPLKPVEYETVDGTIRLWIESYGPSWGAHIPCRLLGLDVEERIFREAYEMSRGPRGRRFNRGLVAIRNSSGRYDAFQGRRQFTRFSGGAKTEKTHDRDSLAAEMTSTLGLSPEFVDMWARSGALDACFQYEDDPVLAMIELIPPSRRRRSPG